MSNINLGSPSTKVLGIVYHNTKNKTVANLLEALMGNKKTIASENGKSFTVKIKKMTERFYCDNEVNISSSQKIVFIGDVKEKGNLEPIMKPLYKEHGITIGQSGNKILITTSSILFLKSVDAYKAFYEDFTKISKLPEIANHTTAIWWVRLALASNFSIPLLTLGPLGSLAAGALGVMGGVAAPFLFSKITEQQELFAVTKFYLDYFDKFMKE